jgi:hypothetical protein
MLFDSQMVQSEQGHDEPVNNHTKDQMEELGAYSHFLAPRIIVKFLKTAL